LHDPAVLPLRQACTSELGTFPDANRRATRIAEQKNDQYRNDEIGRPLIALVQTGV
jgi:hypothetical protein